MPVKEALVMRAPTTSGVLGTNVWSSVYATENMKSWDTKKFSSSRNLAPSLWFSKGFNRVPPPSVYFTVVKQHRVALNSMTYHCGNSSSDKHKASCQESLTKDKFLEVLHGKGEKRTPAKSFLFDITSLRQSCVLFPCRVRAWFWPWTIIRMPRHV